MITLVTVSRAPIPPPCRKWSRRSRQSRS